MIDLHSHSTASDGSLSPSELMIHGSKLGLRALALTDHDTVAGIAEARAKAAELDLKFISGVEIEIDFDPGEFHLLGLGVDETEGELLEALSELADARKRRNESMVELFRGEGMAMDLEKMGSLAGTERVGRPHMAEALVEMGVVRTKQEAFDKYLAKGRPFYLPKDCLPLSRALHLIRQAKGVAVVAHPYSLFISKPKLSARMDEWKDLGIEGIEAYHPAAKLGQCRILENMARERGFLVTAGSDFHNFKKPECGLGRTAGGIPIADSYYEDLVSSLSGSTA